MAITHQVSTNSGVLTDSGTGSLTLAINAGSGSDRWLYVAIATRNNAGTGDISSIAYAGASLTAINSVVNGTYRVQDYYLVAPATGSNNLTYQFADNIDAYYVHTTVLNGANQGAPETDSQNTGTGTSVSAGVTTVADGAWLLDCVNADYSTSDTFSATSGQTERSNSGTSTQIHTVHGTEEIPTAGAQTGSWSISVSRAWAYSLVAIAPAGGGGGGATTARFLSTLGVG